MVSVNEEVQSLNIRVFKWNEEVHNVESSQGLFLFCVNENLRNCTSKRPKLLSVFELVNLSNRDSIKELVSRPLKAKKTT
ncbi:hypothetical protein RHMOL_Rhmol01G0075400 [Rhododendron molle]|uniref:Uncharacterized protein n=1 Tax=Rhododendron molle TaxID=49168 RepID=A0ACC0PZK9_RHOML|nr:hypothetical protein RHMOL_Rhmol01G0075400 [Rhododendron molle]